MAITPVFACGWECGVVGAAGQHWSTSNSAAVNAVTFNNGLRSGRVNSGAQQSNFNRAAGGGTLRVQRFYINVVSNPTSDAFIGGMSGRAGLAFKLSDGKVYAGRDDTAGGVTFGATGVTLSAGWHLVDVRVNVIANPWVIEVSVDGAALGTCSPALAATTIASDILGNGSTTTCDIYYDDFVASSTSADYPIGGGKVLGFVPASDGTHTATTTNIVKGTAATPVGAAITSATTDAFNWVNARPIGGGATDATRLINQQTLVTTEYAEVGFAQTTEPDGPRSVEVLTADQQAATTVGGFSTKLNDNGTEDVLITRSAAGVVTDRFVTKQYATMVGGGAWTLARFKALKARFGYSGDATPDQYWRGIMIEAEFAVPSSAQEAPAFQQGLGSGGVVGLSHIGS